MPRCALGAIRRRTHEPKRPSSRFSQELADQRLRWIFNDTTYNGSQQRAAHFTHLRRPCLDRCVFPDEGTAPSTAQRHHDRRRGSSLPERGFRYLGVCGLRLLHFSCVSRPHRLSLRRNRMVPTHLLGHRASPLRQSHHSVRPEFFRRMCHLRSRPGNLVFRRRPVRLSPVHAEQGERSATLRSPLANAV